MLQWSSRCGGLGERQRHERRALRARFRNRSVAVGASVIHDLVPKIGEIRAVDALDLPLHLGSRIWRGDGTEQILKLDRMIGS